MKSQNLLLRRDGAELDVFLYNGEIRQGEDFQFIKFIDDEINSDTLLLILVTPGGSPDAAYKIGKYLQSRYSDITIYIPGFCKSAGTLLAISANKLMFSPYGELGPLDVQMAKTDDLAGLESGLNISEAFLTLEIRAKSAFHSLIQEIVGNSGGIVSFQTASHSATEILGSLYGPVFAKIDPEEVGSRARAMRIGEDYGMRLNKKFGNLNPKALLALSQTYSSHGFVIDREEAGVLFNRVEDADEDAQGLVDSLGSVCRFPGESLDFRNLTEEYQKALCQEDRDDKIPTDNSFE
ncbi:MAG: hypothetical protein OXC26_15925 [Albidovulum sp.]|nr:hypothetical protein [Albidovulum sp.]